LQQTTLEQPISATVAATVVEVVAAPYIYPVKLRLHYFDLL